MTTTSSESVPASRRTSGGGTTRGARGGNENKKMRALDLFSGIGGFSVALQDACETVAYCEIDPLCLRVLEDNMRVGRLHAAPVFNDITKMTPRDVKNLRPDIVVGGFPCQDIAFSGHGAGIEGSRSNLFFEMMRVAGCCASVKHVLLENSPFIRMRGLDRVLALLKKKGFVHIVYGYLSASDVGAVHKRTRWVCLASRDPGTLTEIPTEKLQRALRFNWKDEPVPRVIRRHPKHRNRGNSLIHDRCSLLGNSVVPQFIAYTYQVFVHVLRGQEKNRSDLSDVQDVGFRGVLYLSSPLTKNRWKGLPYEPAKENMLDLHLVDRFGREFYSMPRWYTPVHSKSAWVFVVGKTTKGRWMCNTANNIYYERRTGAVPRVHIVNPEFVEHLMGYPLGWTSAVLQTSG